MLSRTSVRSRRVTVLHYFVVFRQNEKLSVYFLLQHRIGHGQGNKFSSILVGTYDSLFETKPSPYRILHQTPKSQVYYGI